MRPSMTPVSVTRRLTSSLLSPAGRRMTELVVRTLILAVVLARAHTRGRYRLSGADSHAEMS